MSGGRRPPVSLDEDVAERLARVEATRRFRVVAELRAARKRKPPQ